MTKTKNFAGCYTARIGATKYTDKPSTLHIKKKHTYRYGNVWYIYEDKTKADADRHEAGCLWVDMNQGSMAHAKTVYGYAITFEPTLKEALAEIKSWEL